MESPVGEVFVARFQHKHHNAFVVLLGMPTPMLDRVSTQEPFLSLQGDPSWCEVLLTLTSHVQDLASNDLLVLPQIHHAALHPPSVPVPYLQIHHDVHHLAHPCLPHLPPRRDPKRGFLKRVQFQTSRWHFFRSFRSHVFFFFILMFHFFHFHVFNFSFCFLSLCFEIFRSQKFFVIFSCFVDFFKTFFDILFSKKAFSPKKTPKPKCSGREVALTSLLTPPPPYYSPSHHHPLSQKVFEKRYAASFRPSDYPHTHNGTFERKRGRHKVFTVQQIFAWWQTLESPSILSDTLSLPDSSEAASLIGKFTVDVNSTSCGALDAAVTAALAADPGVDLFAIRISLIGCSDSRS